MKYIYDRVTSGYSLKYMSASTTSNTSCVLFWFIYQDAKLKNGEYDVENECIC